MLSSQRRQQQDLLSQKAKLEALRKQHEEIAEEAAENKVSNNKTTNHKTIKSAPGSLATTPAAGIREGNLGIAAEETNVCV